MKLDLFGTEYDPSGAPVPKAKFEGELKCIMDGCDRKIRTHPYCNMHYQRWIKHGDPLKINRVQRISSNNVKEILDTGRFLEK